ncbi:MAG TPA: hypothetical protein VFK72_05270, partial [Nevskia sp.]|nr:hypothetical protein [Nevskia sp.]
DEAKRTFIRVGPVTLGTLLDSERGSDCTCAFHSPGDARKPRSDLLQWADGEQASMFVNGELLRLNVETSEPIGHRVGDKRPIALSSPKVTVAGVMTTTWVCPPDQEECEAVRLRGTVRITTKKGSAKVPLEGVCGC